MRERYNAKARSAQAGPLRKKRRIETTDSNVDLIDPQQQKDVQRKEELFSEMKVNIGAPISSKKRKRMEKYIVWHMHVYLTHLINFNFE
jgi:hypothetical protein